MTRLALTLTLSIFCLWFSVRADAQIDPSSVLLLNQGTRPSTKDNGLDSGRYIVRPRTGPENHGSTATQRKDDPRKSEHRRASSGTDDTEIKAYHEKHPAGPISNTVVGPDEASIVEPRQKTLPNGLSDSTPGARQSPAQVSGENRSAAEGGTAAGDGATDAGGNRRDTRFGDSVQYEDGRRLNILELDVAPMFLYNDSQSDYWFRNYQTVGPGFSAEARVWFNPSFGIQTTYATSLSGHISDSSSGSRNVAATHQWLSAGIRGRHFLTANRQSPVLTFGLDFQEYQFRVPADAQSHGRIRTMGAKLVLESEWPTSGAYSWLLGFSILPKAQHKEAATGLELRSGANVETNSISLSLGGRVHFNRSNAVFFKVSQSVEKNIFSGAAGTADPRSGEIPTGVAILNSFTMLQVGYAWGK